MGIDIELALKEFGLTDKESKTYLALLSSGNVNLQKIAKKLDFPRTTVYNTLNYLMEKGLVSKITKQGVIFFEATEPEKLIEKINQKKKLLERVLPELNEMKNLVKESSSVEIFEGSKGLFTILSDVFNKNQEVCYFGSYSLSVEVLKHQPEHFSTIRMERKIPARIVIETYDEPRFKEKQYKQITQMKFLDSMEDFPCMIFIYGNKVALYTLKGELVGLIIKNEQVAKAMQLVFEMYWKMAKG